MSIIIYTRLDDSISKSFGGGKIVKHHEFKTGVRNLMKAAKVLRQHRLDMRESHGNVGCGVSWMEIDGRRVDQFDLDHVMRDDRLDVPFYDRGWVTIESRTEKARWLLANLPTLAPLDLAADDTPHLQGAKPEDAGDEGAHPTP